MRTIAIHRLRGKGGKQAAPGKEFDPKELGISQGEIENLAKRGAVRIEADSKSGSTSGRGRGQSQKSEPTTDE